MGLPSLGAAGGGGGGSLAALVELAVDLAFPCAPDADLALVVGRAIGAARV